MDTKANALLPCVERTTGEGDATHTVILLHGLGADGHDFAPIVPELIARDWPPLRFVFPHAPIRPVTINRGMKMRAWYDIKGIDIASKQDETGVLESVAQVEALVANEVARGVPSEHIVLAGFSQGGAIALSAGLRHSTRLAAIVALSTYLPLADKTTAALAPANRDIPIFMAHGSRDPVVPEMLGTISRDWLKAHGYDVEWHSYPMPHSVCPQEIEDLRTFLARAVFGPH